MPVFCFCNGGRGPIMARSKTQRTDPSLGGTAKDKHVTEEVWRVADPLCVALGLELVFIQYGREAGGRVLRLYIDKPGGVNLEDCALVSRELGDILDVHLEDVGPYRLEVSSPGVDRPLGQKSDYERFKGQTVKIRTLQPIRGQKNFKGVLVGLMDGQVRLTCADGDKEIPLAHIAIARLVNYNGES
jgi:ribosome maturation factor RimP